MISSFANVASRAIARVVHAQDVVTCLDSDIPRAGRDVVVVSLNSLKFTAVLFFVYPTDPSCVSALLGQSPESTGSDMDLLDGDAVAEAAESSVDAGELDQERIADRYSEISNMVVGRMRSDMATAFRFTGQSTPMQLKISDLCGHVDQLHPRHQFTLRARLGESCGFFLHGAVFFSDESVPGLLGSVQLLLGRQQEQQDDSAEGELELL